ncbi:hypothetical protein ABIE26_004463 [Pedobacter africanus]|uniref:Uncharacterized protein n=1 Tax=Pedobacter africanus TaxID=151894 RepID=A0ACC6L3X0_9SPHI|nr:helix-turn-helix domain-containing protein [Pedobacter africanus]MDR6786067.1 hypothetical protein [Pedobacter africanus]
MNQLDLVSKQDLEQFKHDLLKEILPLLKAVRQESKQWLRSKDVRKMLRISPGTLQNLRVTQALPFTKVGGIFFYRESDVIKILEAKGSQ